MSVAGISLPDSRAYTLIDRAEQTKEAPNADRSALHPGDKGQ
jgi:hypothetical protein